MRGKAFQLHVACAATLLSFCGVSAPVVPGEFTDPTNLRKAADEENAVNYVVPECARFPYISTYYVKPTLTTSEKVEIPFYVTDWDHSKVRFLDDSFRFDVHFKCVCPDGKVRERTLKGLSSGDGKFEFKPFPRGEYDFCVWASDEKGRESHRVWHKFRVMDPGEFSVPDEKVYKMTNEDLEKYGIRNDGDLGRKILVEVPKPPDGVKGEEARKLALDALDEYRKKNPIKSRDGAPGYAILIAAQDGKPVVSSWTKSKVVFDPGYDTNAVEQAAIATAEGLDRLVSEKAADGYRKVVLLPGTYRMSAFRKIRLPELMTLDLNGATLKQNAFAGCHSLLVGIEHVYDAHLVNGILEGDYYEHDYASSPNNSEWPMAFHIDGESLYCSVENVLVRDVAGYGAGNGMGRVNGQLQAFYGGFGKYVQGGLNPKDGTIDEADKARCTSDFIDLAKAKATGRLQVSAYLGYQGIRGRSWQMAGCWYDAEKRFLAYETIYQYRVVPIPHGAAFLRVSIAEPSVEAASKAGLCVTRFFIPRNCVVRNCVFDRCRCVGYAASAMKNMLFEDNTFTHSGESSAKCAFDAEDGWDMMQDVTFRGNRCVENPVNNRLLTCAGHNFVFERNHCGIYTWPRTYSLCARDNEIDGATFKCDTRTRSGYSRFERNVYKRFLSISTGMKTYPGWDYVLSGFDWTGPAGDENVKLELGPTARVVASSFADREVSVPRAVGCSFRNCTFTRLAGGRWLGSKVEGGKFYVLTNTNIYERCEFRDVEFHTIRDGLQTFRDCLFDGCRFAATGGANVKFENCTFKGGSLVTGYWAKPGNFTYEGCTFDVTDSCYFKSGAYAIGDVLFDKCRFASSNGSCERVVDLFDYRPSEGDSTDGVVAFRGCTVGKGIPSVVGCSTIRANGYLKQGNPPTKKLKFSFQRNKLPPGSKERDRLPGDPEAKK